MDMHNGLEELFKRIESITGIKDIGYHEIKEGRLSPVLKTNTDVLGLTRWKETHARNPVHIKGTQVLEEIIRSRCPAVVQDVKHDARSAEAFFFFGIDSIVVVPVLSDKEVKGIVCIASIGRLHDFQEIEINECIKLVNNFFEKEGSFQISYKEM